MQGCPMQNIVRWCDTSTKMISSRQGSTRWSWLALLLCTLLCTEVSWTLACLSECSEYKAHPAKPWRRAAAIPRPVSHMYLRQGQQKLEVTNLGEIGPAKYIEL